MQPTTTITTQVPGYYKCGHCALHFKTRARFQAHEATCLSLKQIRARATFAPEHVTTAELFAVVQQLAVRLETAEQELSVLRRQQQTQTQTQKPPIHAGNLLQWLNEVTETNATNGTNATMFSEWLPAIPALSREHLERVFQHGFMDGLCAIIALCTAEGRAIRAYDEAPGALFVYEGDADGGRAWRRMAHSEFERFINRMQKLLMNEFVRWQQEHRERWHEPDFAEQYDANLLKVTGSGKGKSGGCSNRDMLMTRLKPKVYTAIKRSANGVRAAAAISMSIFNNANNDKSFNGPQPQLNSSDRTAYLKSKTKYAAAVNLAKNGGVLTKANGARYVGSVQTTRTGLTSASSYSDYLDVAKGKYLLTPPPSSNLAASFQTSSADVYYGNFMVTNYDKANVFLTMLGYPLKDQGYLSYYPNILVKERDSTPSAPTPNMFNQDNIVVDPQFRLFYDLTACGSRNYFQNVTIDPTLDLTFTLALDEVYSLRPEIEQQAQRIIKGEAQRLRSFQFPTRIHFDLDNCDSKASITPVAPDAPVISVSSITPAGPFTVTIAWLQGFDGGRPITAYTVYVDGAVVATLDPQPCRNTHTLTDVGSGSSIWVTASNCLPKEVWNRTTEPSCTTLTSARSNVLVVPVFATVTWSSGMPVPNEVAQAVHLIIPSGVTLVVASGVTMTIRGSVTNNGTLNNAGVIHIYGSLVNNNNGVFTNTGGGTVINYSSNSVTNRGMLTNHGTLTNESGGVIENKAGGIIDNIQGTFNNHGTFLKSEMSTFNGAITTGNAPVLVPAPPVVSPLAWQGKGFVEGAAADKSGQSVSLSSDGSIVAVGAPGANSRRGVVRIYKRDPTNGQWTLMGSPIEGVNENEQSGTSVSLSSDGSIVAVGAPSGGPMAPKGITRIYKWTGQWTLMGLPIEIEDSYGGDNSGKSVSLSANGLTVAIGAPFYEKKISGIYVQHGTTRIYKWDDTNAYWKLSWQIDGLTNYEGSGWSVSLSSNGLTVAIGAPIWGNGVTRVYQYQLTNDTWTLMGSVIPGVMVNGASGYSVSLYSNDHPDETKLITMVAVGAPYANTLKGETRVYQWGKDVSDPERYQWIMLGHLYAQDPIAGLATGENNGYSVSLHSDPDTQTHTVAICAPGASYVKHKSLIYRYHPYSNQSEAMWVAMTKQLHSGEQAESACLSSNGKIAVFGAPNQGITRMYAATSAAPTPTYQV